VEGVIQLRVYLEKTKPVIWRRLRVSDQTTLFELHHIIQISFGWKNYHAYEFSHYGFLFGQATGYQMSPQRGVMIDSKTITLESILVEERENLKYEYDFGDSWVHRVVVERFLKKDEIVKYPYCMSGKHTSPPDDCGGIKAYYNMLNILKNPNHHEHKDTAKWIGKEYTQGTFDKNLVNGQLSQLDQYIKDWLGS